MDIYTLHGYLDISCIYGGMLLKDLSYTYMEIVIYIYNTYIINT